MQLGHGSTCCIQCRSTRSRSLLVMDLGYMDFAGKLVLLGSIYNACRRFIHNQTMRAEAFCLRDLQQR